MTPFQWSATAFLAALLVAEIATFRRSPGRWQGAIARSLLWIVVSLAILLPGLVQRTADLLGIGRGADAVLYGFVLAFLATSSWLYARTVRLQRQVTALARELAIERAERGGSGQSGRNSR